MHEEAVKFFRLVFDHMECRVRLSRRPFKEHSARALLLLDRRAKIRQLSNGAQRLMSKPGALSIVNKELVAASLTEQRKLDRGLAHALEVLGHGEAPSAIRVENPYGSPWIVVIRPLLNSYGPFGNIEAEVQVEIHAGLPRIGDLKLLQSLFNLTGREVQIVRSLADGHSVESMSESMAISANTARTHLRSIFSKTDTTRQSELLQLAGGLSSRDG